MKQKAKRNLLARRRAEQKKNHLKWAESRAATAAREAEYEARRLSRNDTLPNPPQKVFDYMPNPLLLHVISDVMESHQGSKK